MFKTLFPFALFAALNVAAIFLVGLLSCENKQQKEPKPTQEKAEASEKISKIEISEFGKVTSLNMKYDKNVINIEFQPYKGNVESRIELNDQQQIQEIISGTNRIQYLYDDNGRQFGILNNGGIQQIMFDYDGENIAAQHTIRGNDTTVSFRYTYVNGLPSEVEIEGKYPYYRKYELTYSDVDNQLSGFNEMILPAETSAMLGIPALYGKKYLRKAVRVDASAAKPEELKEGYTPRFEVIEFEITRSGKQEELKLVTDGSRQWSAKIFW